MRVLWGCILLGKQDRSWGFYTGLYCLLGRRAEVRACWGGKTLVGLSAKSLVCGNLSHCESSAKSLGGVSGHRVVERSVW